MCPPFKSSPHFTSSYISGPTPARNLQGCTDSSFLETGNPGILREKMHRYVGNAGKNKEEMLERTRKWIGVGTTA